MQTTQYSPQGGLGSGRPFDKALDTTVGLSLPLERGNKAQLRRTAAEAQLDGATSICAKPCASNGSRSIWRITT